jgi:hypothetical protein
VITHRLCDRDLFFVVGIRGWAIASCLLPLCIWPSVVYSWCHIVNHCAADAAVSVCCDVCGTNRCHTDGLNYKAESHPPHFLPCDSVLRCCIPPTPPHHPSAVTRVWLDTQSVCTCGLPFPACRHDHIAARTHTHTHTHTCISIALGAFECARSLGVAVRCHRLYTGHLEYCKQC